MYQTETKAFAVITYNFCHCFILLVPNLFYIAPLWVQEVRRLSQTIHRFSVFKLNTVFMYFISKVQPVSKYENVSFILTTLSANQ